MSELTFDGTRLVLALGFVGVLVVVLAGLRALIRVLKLSAARRAAVGRVLPAFEFIVVVLYAAATVPAIFGDGPLAALAAAFVLVAAVFAAWTPMRDLVSGVIIKGSGAIKIGDTLEVDDVSGRVKHIGLRVVHLETSFGDEAWVPFSHLTRHAVVRTPAVSGSFSHRFSVFAPENEKIVEAKQLIREIALLSHWSQVARDPEVHLAVAHEGDRQGVLKVLVFPVDPGRGPDIEASVRRALARALLIPEQPETTTA